MKCIHIFTQNVHTYTQIRYPSYPLTTQRAGSALTAFAASFASSRMYEQYEGALEMYNLIDTV